MPSRHTGLWAGGSLCLLWKWAFRLSQYPFQELSSSHQWSQSRALDCRTLETLHECIKGLGATLLCTGAGKLSFCPALSINMEDDGEAQGRPADQGVTSSCQYESWSWEKATGASGASHLPLPDSATSPISGAFGPFGSEGNFHRKCGTFHLRGGFVHKIPQEQN